MAASRSTLKFSLPDIPDLPPLSGRSVTCGRPGVRAQLPLDKSNSRFLKQSVQSFYQESEHRSDELRRLELSVDVLDSYCNSATESGIPSKELQERIEKQANLIGQNANGIWTRNKRNSSPSTTPTSEGNLLSTLASVLQRCNSILSAYCNHLSSHHINQGGSTKLQYSWNEPLLDNLQSLQGKIQELLDVLQSREYQLKFCHANLSERKSMFSAVKTLSLRRGEHMAPESTQPCIKSAGRKHWLILAIILLLLLISSAIILAVFFS